MTVAEYIAALQRREAIATLSSYRCGNILPEIYRRATIPVDGEGETRWMEV